MGVPVWIDQAGWTEPSRAPSIGLADIDGDGNPELLGRSTIGVEVWTLDPAGACDVTGAGCGQWTPFTPDAITAFSDANGSDVAAGGRILAGDLDGDGADEVVGWTAGGTVVVLTWDPDTASFAGPVAVPGLDQLTFGSEYETLMLTDVDGDGRHEVAARTPAGLRFAELGPGGWTTLPTLTAVRNGTTWADNAWEYRTLMPAQLDGAAGQEIVGHGAGAVVAWRFDPASRSWETLPTVADSAMPATAWRERHTTVSFQPIDRDGDGTDELFVIGSDDVYLLSLGTSSWSHEVVGSAFVLFPDYLDVAVENGAVTVAQLDSRPGQELVIHDGAGLTGHWFGPDGTTRTVPGPEFSAAHRFNDVNARTWYWPRDGSTASLVVGRASGGVQTARNVTPTTDSPTWRSPSATFPVFTGDESTAYDYISTGVGATDPGGVRSHYGDTVANITADLQTLGTLTPPTTIPAPVFTAVSNQVRAELTAALRVAGHYDKLGQLYTEVFAQGAVSATTVAHIVQVDASRDATNKPIELAHSILHAIQGAIAEIPEVGGFLSAAAAGVDVVLQYFEGQADGGDFSTAINRMDQAWADRFARVLADLDDQRAGVVADYGLLRTIASSIADGSWTLDADNEKTFRWGATRGAELTFYQALVPLAYEVWYCRTGDVHDFTVPCEQGTGPSAPAKTIAHVGQDGSRMWLAQRYERDALGFMVSWGIGTPGDLADKLFDPTTSACAEVWTSDCAFGLAPAAVYTDGPGWSQLGCSSSITGDYDWEVSFYRYHRPCDRVPPESERFQATPPGADESGGPGRDWITFTIDGFERTLAQGGVVTASRLLQFHARDPDAFDLAEVLPNGRVKRLFDDDGLVRLRPNANYITIETGS